MMTLKKKMMTELQEVYLLLLEEVVVQFPLVVLVQRVVQYQKMQLQRQAIVQDQI